MTSIRNYNIESEDKVGHRYAYGFDFEVIHPYMIKSFEPFLREGSLLELAASKGILLEDFYLSLKTLRVLRLQI